MVSNENKEDTVAMRVFFICVINVKNNFYKFRSATRHEGSNNSDYIILLRKKFFTVLRMFNCVFFFFFFIIVVIDLQKL